MSELSEFLSEELFSFVNDDAGSPSTSSHASRTRIVAIIAISTLYFCKQLKTMKAQMKVPP